MEKTLKELEQRQSELQLELASTEARLSEIAFELPKSKQLRDQHKVLLDLGEPSDHEQHDLTCSRLNNEFKELTERASSLKNQLDYLQKKLIPLAKAKDFREKIAEKKARCEELTKTYKQARSQTSKLDILVQIRKEADSLRRLCEQNLPRALGDSPSPTRRDASEIVKVVPTLSDEERGRWLGIPDSAREQELHLVDVYGQLDSIVQNNYIDGVVSTIVRHAGYALERDLESEFAVNADPQDEIEQVERRFDSIAASQDPTTKAWSVACFINGQKHEARGLDSKEEVEKFVDKIAKENGIVRKQK